MIDKIVLRDDLTWSDGKPITAHDFEFLVQGRHDRRRAGARGATEPIKIKWVEAYDDHTLVYSSRSRSRPTPNTANFPSSQAHLREVDCRRSDDGRSRVPHATRRSSGRRRDRTSWSSGVRNQEFVVRRRESYYMHNGKQVRPSRISTKSAFKVIEDFNTALLALKGGQIEEMELRPEQWVTQTNGDDFYARNTKVTALEWTEFHFGWNMKSPFFDDKRVRQAMAYAFDYNELLEHDLPRPLSTRATGTFHPTAWMFPKNGPQPYHQDFDKAEDLLDEAGWTDTDGDGIRDKEINGQRVPFEFTLLTYQTETGMQAATLMKECLRRSASSAT